MPIIPTNTQTQTTQATTVAASVMLAVSTSALFLSWGMLAALVGVDMAQKQIVHMAIESPSLCQSIQPYQHGPRRVIVVLANSQETNRKMDWNRDEILRAVFVDANNFIQQNSYYQAGLPAEQNGVKLVGEGDREGSIDDIYPRATVGTPNPEPYSIVLPTTCKKDNSITGTGCDINNPNSCGEGVCIFDVSQVEDVVINTVDKDINFEDYAQVLVFMDTGGGSYHGIGTMNETLTQEGIIHVGMSLLNMVSANTIAHELGHAFGVGDTGAYGCTNTTDIPETCDFNYAGDVYEIESSNKRFWHSNAPAKEGWGWLQECPDALHKIKTVTASGDYYIRPIEEPSGTSESLPQALKILHGNANPIQTSPNNKYLYIEYRQPLNLDASIDEELKALDGSISADIFQGAMLHVGLFLFDPYLPEGTLGGKTLYQSALPFGQAYTDPSTGTIITIGPEPEVGQPLKISVNLGARTDFEGPIIHGITVTENHDDPCKAQLFFSADDISGISGAIFYGAELGGLEPSLQLNELPVNSFIFDKQTMHLPIKIRVFDNAVKDGGFFNNFSDSEALYPEMTKNCPNSDFFEETNPVIKIESPYLSEPILSSKNNLQLIEGIWGDAINPMPIPVRNPVSIDIIVTDPNLISAIEVRKIDYSEDYLCNICTCFYVGGVQYCPIKLYFAVTPSEPEIKISLPKILKEGIHTFAVMVSNKGGIGLSFTRYFSVNVLPPAFVRGDVDHNGAIDINDYVSIINYLFLGGTVDCLDSADIDDDGVVELTDAIALMNYMFLGTSPQPPAPFLTCGEDPTPDNLSCNDSVVCTAQ